MKSPVVEVEAVDIAEQVHAETVALEEASSEYETDSDDSGDWEALPPGESTIQLLRDEQLRDGLGMFLCCLILSLSPYPGHPRYRNPLRDRTNMDCCNTVPGACTLDEALAYRKRLHDIGKVAFVEETIARETVTAKKLCTAFGILPPAFLEGAPDEAYHSLLAIAISREFSRRPKLPQYNTIDDAVKLLRESKNIIVLTGAGVCSS